MVDVGLLASDVLQNVVYLATLPLLWLVLYLVAWEWPDLARASGFGRLTFWLLLPGAILGTIANLPFFGYSGAILALNLGGGAIPLVLSVLLLRRLLPRDRPALGRFAIAFAAETLVALTWVIVVPDTFVLGSLPAPLAVPLSLQVVGVAIIAAATPLLVFLLTRHDHGMRLLLVATSLTSLAVVVTFLTTQTSPGVGIVSPFPLYLLTPVLTGVLSVLLVRGAAGRGAPAGFGIGYASATLGVLVGADVLRQPPLYQHATNALYSIGGAGVQDLLYLTGLLSLSASLLVYGLLSPRGAPTPTPAVPPVEGLTPNGRLRRSLGLILEGRFAPATQEAARASHDAREMARGLYGLPATSFSGRPWAEAGAPPWVEADQANLDALARAPDVGARDAWRAHLTARHLVRVGRQIGRRRFGTTFQRSAAFVIDLLFMVSPAAVGWFFLSATLPGTATDILNSAAFNAAAFAYAAYAFVYFVVAESIWGTTVGKMLLRLRVRDRALRPVRPVPVMVRDLPKLLPLSIVGFGGAVATLLAVKGGTVAGAGGLDLPAQIFAVAFLVLFIAFGVGLCGLASFIAIYASSENQRLGDYLAGTWVIQE